MCVCSPHYSQRSHPPEHCHRNALGRQPEPGPSCPFLSAEPQSCFPRCLRLMFRQDLRLITPQTILPACFPSLPLPHSRFVATSATQAHGLQTSDSSSERHACCVQPHSELRDATAAQDLLPVNSTFSHVTENTHSSPQSSRQIQRHGQSRKNKGRLMQKLAFLCSHIESCA